MENKTLPPPRSIAREKVLRRILVAIVMVFAAVCSIGAEFGARYYERHRKTPPDYFPQMYYPHQRLRYGLVPNLDYFGWFRINSLGFRGREVSADRVPKSLRIVCLGGSTTFDVGSVGASLPWPEVMERELREQLNLDAVEVLNLGIPGSTTLDSLIDLQTRAMDLKPDLLVVYQGHNDFSYSLPSGNRPASLFPQEDRPRSSFVRWLTNHSVLYAKTEGKVSDLIGRAWATLRPRPAGRDRNTMGSRALDESMERGLRSFGANIGSIVAIAKANRIPLVLPQVVLPFPDAAARSCDVCAGLSPLLGNLPIASIQAMIGRYNDVLRQAASSKGTVRSVDTRNFVPSEDRYYNDPIHFSPEGSKRMGQHLARALVPILQELSIVVGE